MCHYAALFRVFRESESRFSSPTIARIFVARPTDTPGARSQFFGERELPARYRICVLGYFGRCSDAFVVLSVLR